MKVLTLSKELLGELSAGELEAVRGAGSRASICGCIQSIGFSCVVDFCITGDC